MAETILQHWIVTNFALPFLLVFFIVFGVLEKSKLFGDKKQLNAMTAFVIGLIFVGAVFPKLVVSNLILFLTVALVVMFVALLLWGFVASGDKGVELPNGLKKFLMAVIGIAVIVAVFWATGVEGDFFDTLFRSSWSSAFWTNAAFVAVIIVALALVIGKSKSGSG